MSAEKRAGGSGEHEVEGSGERPGLNAVRRLEPHSHGGALAQVADRPIKVVARVAGLAGDIHLRHELAPLRRLDGEMDVRRAPRIGHRPDGAEAVAAVGVRDGAAVALEGLVARPPAGIARMQVAAAGVALPDLDGRTRDRPAVEPEDAARHMGDGALGPRRAAAQHDEVAVDVRRELHRIERPRGGSRRRDEPGLGGKPGRQDQRAGSGNPAGDEAAAADSRGGDQAHGFRPALRAPRQGWQKAIGRWAHVVATGSLDRISLVVLLNRPADPIFRKARRTRPVTTLAKTKAKRVTPAATTRR